MIAVTVGLSWLIIAAAIAAVWIAFLTLAVGVLYVWSGIEHWRWARRQRRRGGVRDMSRAGERSR